MFWSSPSGDIKDTIILIIISLLFSLVFYFFRRKLIVSLFVFSLLSNLIIFFQFFTGSLMFRVYDLYWLQDFSRFCWPIINLILLAILIINWSKNDKTKK